MTKKLITCALLAFGIAATSNAGTEIVKDYSNEFPAQAPPPPAYNYVPAPPPPVYYAPPRVVVYPSVRYVVRPVRVFAFHRVHQRPVYCAP